MFRSNFEMSFIVLVLVTSFARQGPAAAAESTERQAQERIVYGLNSSPAADIAQTLNEVFGDAGVEIVPEVISNSLVIQADKQSMPSILELIGQLDRRPALVSLELIHVSSPCADNAPVATIQLKSGPTEQVMRQLARLCAAGDVKVVDRIQLSTLNNQPAFVRAGARGAAQATRSRQSVSQVTKDVLGTTLGFTPRVADNGMIAIEVDFEKSRLARSGPESTPANDQAVRPPQVDTLSLQTTLQVASGSSVVVGGVRSTTNASCGESLVIVSVRAGTADPAGSDN